MEAAIRRWQAFRQQAGPPNASHAPANPGRHRHHVHSLVRGKVAPARRMLAQGPGQLQLAQAVAQGSEQQQLTKAVAQGLGQPQTAKAVAQGSGQQQFAQAVAQGLLRHQLGLESFQTGPGRSGRLMGAKGEEARGQGSTGRAEGLYGTVDRSQGGGGDAEDVHGIVDPAVDVAGFRGRPCEGAGLLGSLPRRLSRVSMQWLWTGLARVHSRLRKGVLLVLER